MGFSPHTRASAILTSSNRIAIHVPVLVFYCYMTNECKLSSLKQHSLVTHSSADWKSGTAWLEPQCVTG